MLPLVAIIERQSCASVPTPEAEFVVGSHGLSRERVPSLDMLDRVLPADYSAVFRDCNQAMLRVYQVWQEPDHASPTSHTSCASWMDS